MLLYTVFFPINSERIDLHRNVYLRLIKSKLIIQKHCLTLSDYGLR